MPILTFGMPVRPRRDRDDWHKIEANVRAAVASCLRQTSPDIRVLIACTDVPDLPDDDRVEIVTLLDPVENPRLDKGRKKQAIARRLRSDGGGILMIVDDDDLVSRRIAAHVAAHPETDAFFGWHGYELDDRTKRIRYAPQFHHLCGTSAAIRYRVEELPDSDDEADAKDRWIVRAGHQEWRDLCRQAGKAVGWFPFPVALYRTQTGYNINRKGPLGRRIFRRVVPTREIPARVRRDFGV